MNAMKAGAQSAIRMEITKTVAYLFAFIVAFTQLSKASPPSHLISPRIGSDQSRALSLVGGGYFTVPNSTDLQPSSQITIEAWIYAGNSNAMWLSKGDGANCSSDRSYDWHWNGQQADIAMFFGTSTCIDFGIQQTVSNWMHVAVVYSSQSGLYEVFTNGILAVATTTDNGGTPLAGKLLRQSSRPLTIGQDPYWYTTTAVGYMDEVRIWNIARTAQQIQQDMSCQLTGLESNLVAYWNFDDGTANDVTGRGHNGTLVGTASITSVAGIDVVHSGCNTNFSPVQYVQVGTLPISTASERAEVFDPISNTIFSFPYYNSGDLTSVFSAQPGTNEVFTWSSVTSFQPARTTYWGRGACGNSNLYFSGTIDSVSMQAAINTNGTISSWQSMTPLPTPLGGRGRSLHQAFIYKGKYYVVGGWYGDGLPAYSDVYYAPILPSGLLGSFVQTTSLPTGVSGHSATVTADGKVYVASGTNLYFAQISSDGTIGGWSPQLNIIGMNHSNLGNNAIAVINNVLVVVDYNITYLCRLNEAGQVVSQATAVNNLDYLWERSVFINNGKLYVTSATGVSANNRVGKIYRLDGVNLGISSPYFSPFKYIPGSGPRISISGPTGRFMRVDTSSNLLQWVPLMTFPNPAGTIQFTDPSAGATRQRFYRAVSQ